MRGVEDSMTDARIFELSFLRQFGLAGLGIAESKSKEYPSGGKGDAVWQRFITRLAAHGPKPCVSTNFTTPARMVIFILKKGFCQPENSA